MTSSIAIVKWKSSTPFIISPFVENLFFLTKKIDLNFVDMSHNQNKMSDSAFSMVFHIKMIILHFEELCYFKSWWCWRRGTKLVVGNWLKSEKRKMDWGFYKKFPDITCLVEPIIRGREFLNFLVCCYKTPT